PGSTKSNASSPSSPNALSVVALSSPPPTSSKKSITSSARTTQIRCPLYGLPQPTRSSRKSRDFVSEFPGQNTRFHRQKGTNRRKLRATGGAIHVRFGQIPRISADDPTP